MLLRQKVQDRYLPLSALAIFQGCNPARSERRKVRAPRFPFSHKQSHAITCEWPGFPVNWTSFPLSSVEDRQCFSQFVTAEFLDPLLQGKSTMRKNKVGNSTELSYYLCLNLTQTHFFPDFLLFNTLNWLRWRYRSPVAGTCRCRSRTENELCTVNFISQTASAPDVSVLSFPYMTQFKFWLTFNLIRRHTPSIPPFPSHISTQLTSTRHSQFLQRCIFTRSSFYHFK